MFLLALAAPFIYYPLAFMVFHGLNPAGWPDVPYDPHDWFAGLQRADFSMVFSNYSQMAHHGNPAFAGGGFLELMVLVVGIIFATPIVVFGGMVRLSNRTDSSIYGSTDWATRKQRARLKKGLEIGVDLETKGRIRIQVEGNLLTIAPPRTGKTDGFIIPNLAFPEKSAWSGPAVVIDPKGDAYRAVKRRRMEMGRTVRCLDPLDLVGGRDRWNPLLRIDPKNVLYMQSVAKALLPETGAAGDNAAYFTNSAVDLIVGAMIGTIKDGRPDAIGAAALINDDGKLREILRTNEDAASAAVLSILNMEDRGRDYILATARQATQWLRDERMQSVVTNNTFEMSDLLSGTVDLFITLPADDRKYILAPYVRWLLSDLFEAFRTGRRKKRLVVFIDEANVLGRFGAVLNGVGELPGYGISLWTIWQTRSQIVETYGDHGADTLLGTAQMVNLFNLSRSLPEELERWSGAIGSFTGKKMTIGRDARSGEKTESFTLEAQRLAPATDLPSLLEKSQIVLLTGRGFTTAPIKLGRTYAYLDPRFAGLVDFTAPVGTSQ